MYVRINYTLGRLGLGVEEMQINTSEIGGGDFWYIIDYDY